MNPVILDQCLPEISKLLTGVLERSVYNYLTENSLYPTEQKGNFKKSRGTKDQLLNGKMIRKNAKRQKTNLNMAWIDYKMAFDSLPYSWINTCLKMFEISKNIQQFFKKNMETWKTVLKAYSEETDAISIKNMNILQGFFATTAV